MRSEPMRSISLPSGAGWETPQGELYHTIRTFDSATPIAHARRRDNNEPQVCVWTNQYGKGRVFATTVGHYNQTMADPAYLGVARGAGVLFVQITLNAGRTVEMKKAFLARLADLLAELGVRREDVLVSLVEVSKENWSFGNGVAQYA